MTTRLHSVPKLWRGATNTSTPRCAFTARWLPKHEGAFV